MSWLHALLVNEDGQDLIEYGLLAAFVSLAVITSIGAIGTALDAAYGSFATDVEEITTP